MTNSNKTDTGPGKFSLWFQRRSNARTVARIRGGKGRSMGMDLLVLTTTGRRTGQRHDTPLSRFADGDGWLVIASGGGSSSPQWFRNLTANPDGAAVELPGTGSRAVTPEVLDGPTRDQAWARIVEAQARYAKYQDKSDRLYPVVRLTPRGPTTA
ncbi:MAG: nitroreductase [Pseudonocardia sp. SCN 72-86]|mgnify:CR=1 FL=1|nr:MAG: nitroreductase [Pseudonocardia sp. SCN 72-86]